MKMKWMMTWGIGFLALMICGASCDCGSKKQKAEPVQEEAPLPAPEPVPPDKILSPIDSIKDLDKKVESYKTAPHLTPEEIEANRKLKQQIIRGTFDIRELCTLALDIHWEPMTEAERNNFVHLLTDLLEKKAIFSKEQVKGRSDKAYRIAYLGQKFPDPEKKSSIVMTRITVPSEKITLNVNYKLKLTPYGWKIFDVIVDDASLVENYKFQFDTIIRKHGRAELEARMRKKLKEME